MKRLIAVVAASISLTSIAATWERAGLLQVTDTTGLAVAVAKLGELSGNQMLGALAAAQVAQLPTSEFFGPMRQGGSMAFPVYFDSDVFTKSGAGDEEAFDDLDDNAIEFAVVYPMALPKDEFMKLHDGAFETNGLVCVKGLPFGDADDDDFTYIAFAEDGRWAVASDKPEQVEIALKDLAELVAPMDGDIVRIVATPKGMDNLRKIVDIGARKCAEKGEQLDESLLHIIKGLASARYALRVGDAGIDIHGEYSALPGSRLSSMGSVTFSAESLSAASDEDLLFTQTSFAKMDIESQWKLVAEVLAKHKIDTSSFMTWHFAPASRIVVDLPSLVKFIKSADTNGLDEVDFDDVANDVKSALSGKDTFVPAVAPESIGLAFAGYRPQFSAADRFLATLPEAKGKPLVGASVGSLSGIVQAILPAFLASLDDEARVGAAAMAALLPKETRCGIVSASWRQSETSVAGVFRISADEIKGIGVGVGAIAAASMSLRSAAPDDDFDDEDLNDPSDED